MVSLLPYRHTAYTSRGDQPAVSELSAAESHLSFYILGLNLALVKMSELKRLHSPEAQRHRSCRHPPGSWEGCCFKPF